MTALRPMAVPFGSFVLAVMLSILSGSSAGSRLRAAQAGTGQPCCEVCVQVIVLGPAEKGSNKGKAGSKYAALSDQDRADIKARVKVAADLWAKCCVTLKFNPAADLKVLPATPGMVEADGNLIANTLVLYGEFFKEYYSEIAPKCLNLLLIRNGATGTVKTLEPGVDGPFRNGNISSIPDDKMDTAERGGTSMAHEMGHQLRNGEVSAGVPDGDTFVMYFNQLIRKLPSQGGGIISPEECARAYARACESSTSGFKPEVMLPWLIESMTQQGRPDLADDLEKLQRKLEKGKTPK